MFSTSGSSSSGCSRPTPNSAAWIAAASASSSSAFGGVRPSVISRARVVLEHLADQRAGELPLVLAGHRRQAGGLVRAALLGQAVGDLLAQPLDEAVVDGEAISTPPGRVGRCREESYGQGGRPWRRIGARRRIGGGWGQAAEASLTSSCGGPARWPPRRPRAISSRGGRRSRSPSPGYCRLLPRGSGPPPRVTEVIPSCAEGAARGGGGCSPGQTVGGGWGPRRNIGCFAVPGAGDAVGGAGAA